MRILVLLKKHYFATAMLLVGLILLGYLGWKSYEPENIYETKTQTEIRETKPLENIPENKTEKNTGQPQLQIPEITKPTSTENQAKNIEAATLNKTETAKQSTSTPVDLTQGTFIISGKSYPVSFIAYQSVYDVMQQLHTSGQIKVDFKDYSGLGYFVDGIDGVKSDTFRAKYWIYYINGAKAQVGISNYQLKSGDVITWKYESAE